MPNICIKTVKDCLSLMQSGITRPLLRLGLSPPPQAWNPADVAEVSSSLGCWMHSHWDASTHMEGLLQHTWKFLTITAWSAQSLNRKLPSILLTTYTRKMYTFYLGRFMSLAFWIQDQNFSKKLEFYKFSRKSKTFSGTIGKNTQCTHLR